MLSPYINISEVSPTATRTDICGFIFSNGTPEKDPKHLWLGGAVLRRKLHARDNMPTGALPSYTLASPLIMLGASSRLTQTNLAAGSMPGKSHHV